MIHFESDDAQSFKKSFSVNNNWSYLKTLTCAIIFYGSTYYM